MNYIGAESYADAPAMEHSPAYTWANPVETYSSTYRINEMHPSVNYQLWTYPPGCTAGAADSPVPGYELSFDSSPSYSSIMIDTPSSPLAVPATVEEQRESTPDTENLPALPRKAAGRTPRKPYPVIVPNLTKKARGRQVPTKDMLLQSGSGRVFACQVDNCRKVFTRSEHLKRHTRSIHTHEKPFKCEEPNCGRLFTRHDNLLQHLKNNRHLSSYLDADCRPLDRVLPPSQDLDSARGESMPLSPTMGVLMPPLSPTTALTYSQLPMNDLDVASSYEATSPPPATCEGCEGSSQDSQEGTPAPCEELYEQDEADYSWQPPDAYPLPQYQYAAVPHLIRHQISQSAGVPLEVYGYHA